MTGQRNTIIVALDFDKPQNALQLVDRLGTRIDWYKVGPVLFTKCGEEIVHTLHKRKKRVFLDLKLHDIPSVVSSTLRQISSLGVEFTTVHCLGGKSMLNSWKTQIEGPLKVLGVTLLTSHSQEDLGSLGWKLPADELVSILVAIAVENKLSGIVCSPLELPKIRKMVPPGFLIVTPGVRPTQSHLALEDQSRTTTPSEAIQMGADYLVVGRPITQSADPCAAVDKLFD